MPGEQVGTWEWDKANNIWLPKPAVVVAKRMVAFGQVIAGAHKLYWITLSSGAGNSIIFLTDDLTGLTAIVYHLLSPQNYSCHVVLDPPMPFTNGIYLSGFVAPGSVIFGYV